VAILAAIVGTGWLVQWKGLPRSRAWLLIMGLMGTFAVVAGRSVTGYWRGILIDNRNKMSLARFQFLMWTLVVLSAIATAVMTNALYNAPALSITVPQELWVLLGISTVSAIAAPAVLHGKDKLDPDPDELKKTAAELRETNHVNVDEAASSLVVRNVKPADARWGDLLKGDESGDAATVDLGKLQMFFFTFVLALGYCVAIAQMFDSTAAVTGLPVVDSTVNTLLGISHTGYLANTSVIRSREADDAEPANAATDN
jgi:hypothetical protein